MSEEIKKAYKLFNREDLIDDGYERDLDSNIQVFLTTKQMINYMNLQQKVEKLENIRKEAIKLCDEMLSILYHYDDRKIWEDMKDILNKGSDKE